MRQVRPTSKNEIRLSEASRALDFRMGYDRTVPACYKVYKHCTRSTPVPIERLGTIQNRSGHCTKLHVTSKEFSWELHRKKKNDHYNVK
jgi:hypothetical protein